MMRSDFEHIAAYMRREHLALVSVECGTDGETADLLARLQDHASWLRCSFLLDRPQALVAVLGVAETTLRRFGPASEEVATEAAIAALDQSSANVAMATVGDAAQGRMYFAWAVLAGGWVRSASAVRDFSGSGGDVRQQAARFVLAELPTRHADLMRHEREALILRFA